MIDTDFLSMPVKNTAILMRHADREHIISGVNDHEPINEAGRANSVRLGERFSLFFDSVKVFASPIDRCIQTGEAIIAGLQKNGTVSQSNMLGEPGPFVLDKDLALEVFRELGCIRVVESQIAGDVLPGVKSVADGSEQLKNFIVSEMRTNDSGNLLLFITHDAIVAPFVHHYTGEMFDKSHWLGFSDGVAFVEEDDGIQLYRNGKKYAIR